MRPFRRGPHQGVAEPEAAQPAQTPDVREVFRLLPIEERGD